MLDILALGLFGRDALLLVPCGPVRAWMVSSIEESPKEEAKGVTCHLYLPVKSIMPGLGEVLSPTVACLKRP